MIICPNCNAEIDDHSVRCEQCGNELYYCLNCRQLKRGRSRCGTCGSVLVPVSDRASMIAMRPSQRLATKPQRPNQNDETTVRETSGASTYTPIATVLVRDDINSVQLRLIDGAIIGRVHGEYASKLGALGYVSGRHARLNYDKERKVWTITDLNSTNGTKINDTPIAPDVPVDFNIGDTITIAFTAFSVK